MKSRSHALSLAAVIALIIVSIGLGFLTGLSSPIPWLLIVALGALAFALSRKKLPAKITWKESYSVGIKAMDDDHKKLIILLNKFQTAYDYSTDEAFEQKALEELVAYTQFHFAREEEMMAEAGYEDLENHKQQHQKMIAQVNVFVEKYRQDGHDSLNEVSQFLSQWLINHINGTDKLYSESMKRKGL